MRLTLAIHPVTEIRFGTATRLAGTRLEVNREELKRYLMEDRRLHDLDLEIVRPGENCRMGMIFDIVEPRAKEPGSSPDFPGIIGPQAPAGWGTTHVLRGAVVTVLEEGREVPSHSPRGASKILEMGGEAATATPYASMQHLVVVPHPHPDIDWHLSFDAMRVTAIKAAVYLGRAGIGQRPATNEVFDLELGAGSKGREGLPRLAYIAQVHGHQYGTEKDEKIIYGHNTLGMIPVPLHPNEWLDGAIVISYAANGNIETYYYQNHPVILELYRQHNAGEITFAGTVAMAAADLEEERERSTMFAAHLVKNVLHADGTIVTKYSGGGAPHSDMFETARLCEGMGVKTTILVTSFASDGRTESAALMNIPEVNAIVCIGSATNVKWKLPAAERIIAGSPAVAARIGPPQEVSVSSLAGGQNMQGASRLASVLY